MQESEMQAEYDNVLREAKLLRLDLQHALTKCLEHRVRLVHNCAYVLSVMLSCCYSFGGSQWLMHLKAAVALQTSRL